MILATKPFKHQLEALQNCYDKTYYGLFMEMGTGKSKIIIDETVNLIAEEKINCVLVIAPNGIHEMWAEQYGIHAPRGFSSRATIQIYRSKNGTKQEAVTREIIESGKILVFLMNIEALSTDYGFAYAKRILMARRKTYFVIDESHKIKTPGALRTKRAIALGQAAKYRRIATGTEAEEGIQNLWSQMKFLDPSITGHRTFSSFRGMYCRMGGYENRQILGYQNQKDLAKNISPHVYQIRKKDCLDLPEQIYVTHHISMTSEQSKMYTQLEEELFLLLGNPEKLIDATLAITRMLRLQQVLCGHIDNKMIPSNRCVRVKEIVEGISGKVLVFCRFKLDVQIVLQFLRDNGIGAIGFDGDMSSSERTEILNSWRNSETLQVLIMTAATGGSGYTLNEAKDTIFYSNGFSLTERYQAEARNHRVGQGDKVTYHDIVVRGKLDSKILKVLRDKKDAAEMFRSLIGIKEFLLAGEDA